MIDQLIIGDKASFDDYGASLTKRKIGMPVKKKIKETVPFSNITYDFSAINGEVYWEERSLEYIFEIIAENAEKLEELKLKFAAWVMSVQGERLQDPFIPDYHFNATYDDMSFEDEEGLEKTTATVKFTAYPYMIANNAKVYERVISPGGNEQLLILNESAHPVAITVTADHPVTIEIGAISYDISAGTYADERMRIPAGLASIKLSNNASGVCDMMSDLAASYRCQWVWTLSTGAFSVGMHNQCLALTATTKNSFPKTDRHGATVYPIPVPNKASQVTVAHTDGITYRYDFILLKALADGSTTVVKYVQNQESPIYEWVAGECDYILISCYPADGSEVPWGYDDSTVSVTFFKKEDNTARISFYEEVF